MDADAYENDQYAIKYTNNTAEKEIIYDVHDKRDKQDYSLTISERGFVTLKRGEDKLADIRANLDQVLRNIGGHEQYQFVEKNINVGCIDGVMETYRKVRDADFHSYSSKDQISNKQKNAEKKLVLSFMDKYIFNTPESREVLNEYLRKHTKLNPALQRGRGGYSN